MPGPPGGTRLEGACPVRGAQPGRSVVALLRQAQVVVAARGTVTSVEPVVVSLGDVEQRAGVGVLETWLDGGGVAGQAVDPGDQRGGGAGPLDGEPGAEPLGQ